jgi:hypothetical protein
MARRGMMADAARVYWLEVRKLDELRAAGVAAPARSGQALRAEAAARGTWDDCISCGDPRPVRELLDVAGRVLCTSCEEHERLSAGAV